MSLLLRKLLGRFLTLPVDGDAGTTPAADSGAADAGTEGGEGTLDDLLDAAGELEDIASRETPPEDPPAVREARRDAESARRELEAERAARRALEARAAPAPTTTHDPEYEAEERRLADARARGVDANSLGWMEWQIKVARENRETRRYVDTTRRETQDIADQTAFERLEVVKPQFYNKYKDRVEAEVQRLRAQGQNAPRLAILRYLVGDDMVNGKIGSKSSKAPARPQPSQTVDRGRTPGTRTDVSGRGAGASEREKRRERLRNQPL